MKAPAYTQHCVKYQKLQCAGQCSQSDITAKTELSLNTLYFVESTL